MDARYIYLTGDMTATLQHRYQLGKSLGRGGSAEVYLASDLWLERDVVIKIARINDPGIHQSLAREFGLLFRLEHPNIASAFDRGRLNTASAEELGLPQNAPYLAMHYCPGKMASRWRAESTEDTGLTLAILAAQIVSALAALHARGIMHRDIKPENIMVHAPTEDAVSARLIDFGLAQLAPAREFAGTPRYMAPEALEGEAGIAADIYSLGATIAALSANGNPTGENGSTQYIAGPLAKVVETATHPNPQKRASAPELFDMLAHNIQKRSNTLTSILNVLRDQGAPVAELLGQSRLKQHLLSICTTSESLPSNHRLRIYGPDGAGKTAALTEAVAAAALHDVDTPGGITRCTGDSGETITTLLRSLGNKNGVGNESSLSAQWALFAEVADTLRKRVTHTKSIMLLFDNVRLDSVVHKLGHYLHRLDSLPYQLLWIESGAAQETCTHNATSTQIALEHLSASDTEHLLTIARPLRPNDKGAATALYKASGGYPGRMAALLRQNPGNTLLRRARDNDWDGGHNVLSDINLTATQKKAATAVAFFPGLSLKHISHLTLLHNCGEELNSLIALGVLAPLNYAGFHIAGEWMLHGLRAQADIAWLQELAHNSENPSIPRQHRAMGRLHHALGNHEQAAQHLIHAAETTDDAASAVHLYRLAIESADQTGTTTINSIYVRLGERLLSLGRHTEALKAFSAAHTQKATTGQARTLVELGQYETAAHVLRAAENEGNEGERAIQQALYARVLLLQGNYTEAQTYIQDTLTECGPNTHPQSSALHSVLGLVAFYQGKLANARTLLETAAKDADPQHAGSVLANLGLVLHKSGELKDAARAYIQSIEAADRLHDLPKKAIRLVNLGSLYQEQGQFEEALRELSEARSIAQLIDGDRALVRALINEANLLGFLGDCTRAHTLASDGIERATRASMLVESAYLLLVRAEMHLALGSPSRSDNEPTTPGNRSEYVHAATVDLETAARIFAEHADKSGEAECATFRVQLALYAHDLGWAQAEALKAYALAEDAGRERIGAQARVFAAIAHTMQSTTPEQDAACIKTLQPVLDYSERHADPDLGWTVHALLYQLTSSAKSVATTKNMQRAHHLNNGRQLAQKSIARLSARFEQSYITLWHRRNLWALLQDNVQDKDPSPPQSFERLLAINRELALDRDPERLLERIIDAAIALSGAERGFVVLLSNEDTNSGDDFHSEYLSVRAARNLDRLSLEGEHMAFSKTIAAQAMRSGMPVSSLDAQGDDRFQKTMSVHILKLRSVLCLPLRAGAIVLGALYLDHRHRVNAFSSADVALLSSFGDQAAIALSNARLVSTLKKQQEELDRSRLALEDLNQRLETELHAAQAEVDGLERQHPSTKTVQGEIGRHGMVGMSKGMLRVYRIIERVGDRDVPVSIRGESGTGKELVARAIHYKQKQAGAHGSFVSVNCGAIAPQLLESELFGHERGAFTGAIRSKPGLFEVAQNGTIFLDEIGDMPMDMQVKLLRVIQEREFRRVGATKTFRSNARILSATHRDLEKRVAEGLFREDLWYRLNVVEIVLPPLRQRPEDLHLLIEHFLKRHVESIQLSKAAHAALLDYPWPGNVRELENELQRALALADIDEDGPQQGLIRLEAISPKVRTHAQSVILPKNWVQKSNENAETNVQHNVFHGDSTATDDFSTSERMREDGGFSVSNSIPPNVTLKTMVGSFERQVLVQALQAHVGKVSATAKTLGLTRAGLYKKLAKYDIAVNKR